MTYTKSRNRRLIQVSVKPDYYELVRAHCETIDVPMALWVRSLIQREIAVPGNVEHPQPAPMEQPTLEVA